MEVYKKRSIKSLCSNLEQRLFYMSTGKNFRREQSQLWFSVELFYFRTLNEYMQVCV